MFKRIILVALLNIPQLSYAGWSSGGGELIKDSMNPWFLKNTKEVTYCILINHYAMTVTEELADKSIQFAIRYWKREFSKVKHPTINREFEIATQTFRKVQCDPSQIQSADVVFQYGSLNQQQRKFLGDLQKYASIAVRTEYDIKTLRAKGFVYFAAEYGEDQLVGADLVRQPWTRGDGGILHWATLHEVGHIFGVQHTAATHSQVFVNFMASDFVEKIVRKQEDEELFFYVEDPGYYFEHRPKKGYGSVTSKPEYKIRREFFGIPEGHNWLHYKFVDEGLDLYSGQDHILNHATKLGTIVTKSVSKSIRDRVKVYIHAGISEFTPYNFIGTPGYVVEKRSAKFVPLHHGKERSIYYTIDPRNPYLSLTQLGLSGELNGSLYSNILEADLPFKK